MSRFCYAFIEEWSTPFRQDWDMILSTTSWSPGFMKKISKSDWSCFHQVFLWIKRPVFVKEHPVPELRKRYKNTIIGTSLVAQWLRICLPMQVRSLFWEAPTCSGATKPVCHNYWTCGLEPANHNYWACVPQLLKPVRLEPMLRKKRSHHNGKLAHHNEEQPLLIVTKESPRATTKTQHNHK